MTSASTPSAGDSGAVNSTGGADKAANSAKKKKASAKKPNIFKRIVLFIRQVIGELRKVVTPSRSELGTYTLVVLVFVVVMMAYVGLLDFAFGRVVLWAFGN